MRRSLAWFARNPVAANLLALLIVAGGLVAAGSVRQETFPEFSSDIVSVSVVYPGAGPEEVEEGICLRIEDSIRSVEGVERITSSAFEGLGVVNAELAQGADASEVLADVERQVDTIDRFPQETEKPIIREVVSRRRVITVAVYGSADVATLRLLAEKARDELTSLAGISQVELAAAPPREISIETSEAALRHYGLSFDDVAEAIRRSSLDLPGGVLRTDGGEILLRTEGQANRQRDFEQIHLRTRPDGTRLYLGDVARVVDGFAETDQVSLFDGKPAFLVQVFRSGEEDALAIARKVEGYVAEARSELLEGIGLALWRDESEILRGRRDLLLKNGWQGFLLLLIVLGIFLRPSAAFWVAVGIPISFLGAITAMSVLDVSIHPISLFGFVMVLGIVVDDAIVVGENIFRHRELGKSRQRAAVEGVREVATPVLFAVLTNMAAFAPILWAPGETGNLVRSIPIVIIAALFFSLLESLYVLPAHLSHLPSPEEAARGRGVVAAWSRFQSGFHQRLNRLVEKLYLPLMKTALEWRYLSVAAVVALLVLSVGLVAGGVVKFTFFPTIEADEVTAFVTMPQGTTVERTRAAVRDVERKARELRETLREETGETAVVHVVTSLGEQPSRISGDPAAIGGHLGEVTLALAPSEQRQTSSAEVARRWREAVGPVLDASEMSFVSTLFSTGAPIDIQLSGPRLEVLGDVAAEIREAIARYPGVQDVTDTFRSGKEEVKLAITPEAESLGLSLSDLARQVRQAFYGEEAQRIQRNRDEVKVMVRYPADERRSLANLENMRIRTADGEVPFSVVAEAVTGRSFTSVERVDGRRIVRVTADVDANQGDANEILADLRDEILPGILAGRPEVSYSFEGQRQQQTETATGLRNALVIALLVIYILLAMPLKSYIQPVIIMTAIPLSYIGAIWGHLIMGTDLTVFAGYGLMALTGVVVNDSLLLVNFINRAIERGEPLGRAVREAGMARLRPILITSVTTFAALFPLLLEGSVQSQFLKPMAIALGFGILFATGITLVIVPVSYLILQDLGRLGKRLLGAAPGLAVEPADD